MENKYSEILITNIRKPELTDTTETKQKYRIETNSFDGDEGMGLFILIIVRLKFSMPFHVKTCMPFLKF